MDKLTVEEMREDYDWQQVFAYGGKPMCKDRHGDTPSNYSDGSSLDVAQGAECSADPFDFDDVEEVLHHVYGANDEEAWEIVVKLKDGRYAFLSAGCDYTGWDCQSGGSACVSHDYEHLMQFGCTNYAKERFEAAEK